MPDMASIVSQIRATLSVTDPELDTSVGTTTRKIIDAVAEPIAESYVDQHMLAYTYDIDAKVDSDLDDFVQTVGGLARLSARRSSGIITFTRGSGNTTDNIVVPIQTQIGSTTTSPQVVVMTITAASIPPGLTSVSVPCQAVLAGPSGNIGAGLLTTILTPLSVLTDVTNIDPFTGGVDAEVDSELKARWKRTVFRNLAGTEAMYLGIALSDVDVGQANIVGASKRGREQIQIVSGTATSNLDDIAYVYPDSEVLGPAIDVGDIKIRNGDYTFSTIDTEGVFIIPPRVNAIGAGLDASETNPSAIFDLEYEYLPSASRNSPANGITNRIDIFVSGVRPTAATQNVIFSSAKRFKTTGPFGPTAFDLSKFVRHTGGHPTDNNIFIPLAFGPIVSMTSTFTLGATPVAYKLAGVDVAGVPIANPNYWIVHDTSAFGMGANSLFGLEWSAGSIPSGAPPQFTIDDDYTFNAIPADLQASVDSWRLLATDAKVHAAHMMYLRFNIAVVYDRNITIDVVNQDIRSSLALYCSKVGFASSVQVSDVLQTIHNVNGVDNVRMLNSTDNATNYAIQKIDNNVVSTTYATGGRAKDIVFGDAEIPVFHSIAGGGLDLPAVKAANSFGTF